MRTHFGALRQEQGGGGGVVRQAGATLSKTGALGLPSGRVACVASRTLNRWVAVRSGRGEPSRDAEALGKAGVPAGSRNAMGRVSRPLHHRSASPLPIPSLDFLDANYRVWNPSPDQSTHL